MAARSPVFRNALILVGAQLAGTPLAVLLNAMMGRYLGAESFGYIYLASTLTRFGFLFVDWGHSGVLPAAIARDRSVAGEFLGTSIAWRLAVSTAVFVALALGSWVLGYGAAFQVVLALVALQWLLNSVSGAGADAVRGFERSDVPAVAQLGQQILIVAIVVPALMLGGGLKAALLGQVAASALIVLFVWIASRRVGVGALSVTKRAFRQLTGEGAYFLTFGIALAAQANVDAIMLSKLAPPEVVGWQAAAQRLSGVLVIPASALISALYPTLSRLHVEDKPAYVETARQALRGTVALAVPIGVCCALYRELGIELFSKGKFGPAEQNLLVYSVLLPLVYVSMPLGTALLAAGRQRPWAAVQMLCVVVSLALDPLLIPWFQKNYGNGGLGVCVAAVISEIFMVGAGLVMVMRGVVDWSFLTALARALAAGVAMVVVGVALRSITPFAAAPLVLVVYFACLWAIGGIRSEEIAIVKNAVARRLKR